MSFLPATAALSGMPEAKWNQVPPEGEQKCPNFGAGRLALYKYLMGLEDGKDLRFSRCLSFDDTFFFLTCCSLGPDSLRSPQNDSLRSPPQHTHLGHHFSTHLGHHRQQNCERVVTGGHSPRSPHTTDYIPLG